MNPRSKKVLLINESLRNQILSPKHNIGSKEAPIEMMYSLDNNQNGLMKNYQTAVA